MGWFIGIILAVAAIGCAVWAGVAFDDDSKVMGTIAAMLCVVSVIAFVVVPFSMHTVDTGEVAVVKQFGEAKEVKTAGLHYDFWGTHQYQRYDTKVQDVAIETMAYSSDAQTMTIAMTVQYQIMSEKAIDIAKTYGTLEALTSRIQAIAVEKAKSTLSAYKAMDIIANRADMSPAVEEAIRSAVGDEYFVNITTIVLTNIDFSDAFELAVEEKMVAEQKQLKADYENATKIAAAEAEAKAKILAAEATAKANELLEKSLTDKILQEMYLNKWNGVLPSVMTGEDVSVMIPVGDKSN